MSHASAFVDVLKKYLAPALGTLIANVMYFAPLKDVKQARRDGHLGELNPVPWPAINANCIAWIGYSYYTKDWFVFWANQPGLILGMFYTLSAIGLAKEKTRNILINACLAITAVIPMAGMMLSLVLRDWDAEKKDFFWGLLCNLVLVIYYSAPLSTMYQVIATKSSDSLHGPTCCMNMVNSSCWVAYGYSLHDPFIMYPNIVGAVVTLVQFGLIAKYPKTGPKEDNGSLFPTRNTRDNTYEPLVRNT